MALAVVVFTIAPTVSHAQGFTPYWGPILSCTGDYLSKTTPPSGMKPCTSYCDILATAQNAIKFILTILFVIIIPAFTVAGGIMMMISGGKPDMYKKGLNTIKGAVIGLVIAMSAGVIVNTFVWLLGTTSGITTANWWNIKC